MLWIIFLVAVVREIFAVINFKYLYEDYLRIKKYYDEGAGYLGISYISGHDKFPEAELHLVIILLIIAVVSLGIAVFLLKKLRYDFKEIEPKELVSLSTSREIKVAGSGSAFYFAMAIETQNCYSFYYKTGDGGYQRETIDAEITRIYEEEDCKKPRVEKHNYLHGYKLPRLTKVLIFCGDPEIDAYHYEMYVPKGTLLRKMELK